MIWLGGNICSGTKLSLKGWASDAGCVALSQSMILSLELYLPIRILSGIGKTCLGKKTLSIKINTLRVASGWDTNQIQNWPEMCFSWAGILWHRFFFLSVQPALCKITWYLVPSPLHQPWNSKQILHERQLIFWKHLDWEKCAAILCTFFHLGEKCIGVFAFFILCYTQCSNSVQGCSVQSILRRMFLPHLDILLVSTAVEGTVCGLRKHGPPQWL